jgi:AraC-like DNA-binding protein
LESAATIEEVSRKMRDTAGGTPALPLKKRLVLRPIIRDLRSTNFYPSSPSRPFAFIRGSNSPSPIISNKQLFSSTSLGDLRTLAVNLSSRNRRCEAILVRRAIDVCESVSGPVGISELSTALNASPRTLQLAFQKVMGTTPHNFFHRRRLTKARMALLKADSRESRVTDIAHHHGFSELGRFSVQYRELFGESPKVTLRRNLTSSVAIPFP